MEGIEGTEGVEWKERVDIRHRIHTNNPSTNNFYLKCSNVSNTSYINSSFRVAAMVATEDRIFLDRGPRNISYQSNIEDRRKRPRLLKRRYNKNPLHIKSQCPCMLEVVVAMAVVAWTAGATAMAEEVVMADAVAVTMDMGEMPESKNCIPLHRSNLCPCNLTMFCNNQDFCILSNNMIF